MSMKSGDGYTGTIITLLLDCCVKHYMQDEKQPCRCCTAPQHREVQYVYVLQKSLGIGNTLKSDQYF